MTQISYLRGLAVLYGYQDLEDCLTFVSRLHLQVKQQYMQTNLMDRIPMSVPQAAPFDVKTAEFLLHDILNVFN